ncbi:hypothetical protein HHUSO_G9072 [Huso huso]|uniref:Uncharacterized protein n=1 Tax=Huso huso TaxID=61971 RepID=A0ABR0ZSK9_HUSHU
MSSLSNGDKQRLAYPARHQDRLIQGQFKTTKTTSSDTPGTDSLKRCLLVQGSGPAQWPQTSRLVEAICIQLCRLHQVQRCEDFPVGGYPRRLLQSPRAGAGQPEARGEDHPPAVRVESAHPVSMAQQTPEGAGAGCPSTGGRTP